MLWKQKHLGRIGTPIKRFQSSNYQFRSFSLPPLTEEQERKEGPLLVTKIPLISTEGSRGEAMHEGPASPKTIVNPEWPATAILVASILPTWGTKGIWVYFSWGEEPITRPVIPWIAPKNMRFPLQSSWLHWWRDFQHNSNKEHNFIQYIYQQQNSIKGKQTASQARCHQDVFTQWWLEAVEYRPTGAQGFPLPVDS